MSSRPDIRPMYQHWCPNADNREGAPINEFDPDLIHCRCYTGRAFFAAQDAMAIKIDLERGTGRQ